MYSHRAGSYWISSKIQGIESTWSYVACILNPMGCRPGTLTRELLMLSRISKQQKMPSLDLLPSTYWQVHLGTLPLIVLLFFIMSLSYIRSHIPSNFCVLRVSDRLWSSRTLFVEGFLPVTVFQGSLKMEPGKIRCLHMTHRLLLPDIWLYILAADALKTSSGT